MHRDLAPLLPIIIPQKPHRIARVSKTLALIPSVTIILRGACD
jgi:nitrate reductase NapAB chaperone NapD